ncbi:hypothetical protein CRSA0334_16760 [Cronobacter malonaticus ENBT0334]|nr:hypothetical protein CRSA0334_16760 [Cronobacter malonaticus ENBT0334]
MYLIWQDNKPLNGRGDKNEMSKDILFYTFNIIHKTLIQYMILLMMNFVLFDVVCQLSLF